MVKAEEYFLKVFDECEMEMGAETSRVEEVYGSKNPGDVTYIEFKKSSIGTSFTPLKILVEPYRDILEDESLSRQEKFEKATERALESEESRCNDRWLLDEALKRLEIQDYKRQWPEIEMEGTGFRDFYIDVKDRSIIEGEYFEIDVEGDILTDILDEIERDEEIHPRKLEIEKEYKEEFYDLSATAEIHPGTENGYPSELILKAKI